LLANRADELADGVYRIAGKHCESGDVLIQAAELPRPRRSDLLAVPGTGAYTLAMGSNYNGVPRPPAVLVRDGSQRLIRKREELRDLLRHEADTLDS
jgi:diaminopimelate decarboxylase